MSTSNRAAKITKAHRVLKKYYKPVLPPADRSLLEHLLYACCLEDASYETADEAFAKLQELYFDWNEIRVTTVSELAEVMSVLPDPSAAAARLKRILQTVFETHYAFDVEFLKKQNLGKAVQELEKFDSNNPFAIAYATQAGLGGHSIPVSGSAFEPLYIAGIITKSEWTQRRVPGIERAIAKSKGAEFASLLQQLAADFLASPSGAQVRSVLVEIDPEAKDRFPKRGSVKKEKPSRKAKEDGEPTEESASAGTKKKSAPRTPAKKVAKSKKVSTEESTKVSPEESQKADSEESKKSSAPRAKKTPSSSKKSASKTLTKRKPR